MISRQKQIYELRRAVISELELRTVRERMIATLRNRQQFNTGNLQSVIEKIKYEKAVKIKNTEFDSQTGLMTRATVVFEFDFTGAGYAKYLDSVYYSDIEHTPKGSRINNLLKWINNKPKNTWRTSVDLSTERKKLSFAFAISRNMFSRGGVKNKSRFITFSRSNVTTSINKATSRFVDYLSEQLAIEIDRQIFFK